MPNIQLQPASYTSGYTLARSPIIFRYSGCSQNYNYNFELEYNYDNRWITGMTNYTTIIRKPDINGYITIDVQELVKNLIIKRNYYEDDSKNNTFFRGILIERNNNSSIPISILYSNVSYSVLGYSTLGNDVDIYNSYKNSGNNSLITTNTNIISI